MSRIDELRARLGDRCVTVLLGGTSGEREVSLRSGANVLAGLQRQQITTRAVDPRRDDWMSDLIDAEPAAVFLALHGRDGEDGTMQGFLETVELRYTGSGVLASAIAMNKVRSKQIFTVADLPTPTSVVVSPHSDLDDATDDIVDTLGLPVVVKPTSEGSSIGVSVVHERDDLHAALRKRVHDFRDVFAEQFVAGMEVTVGILGVDRSARALPVLELVPTNEFYDYEAKYTAGMTTFHVPARLSEQVTAHVQDVALRAHQCLGCHGFSRVDMMVDSEGRPFITEVNTLPGLTDLSDLPAQASAAGISYDDLILEILESAFVDRL